MLEIIIPVRLESRRFPGKAIHLIKDLPLFVLTYRRACLAVSELPEATVTVATDSRKVIRLAEDYGVSAHFDDEHYPNGTIRVAAAASDKAAYVINWQVDEPHITPWELIGLYHRLLEGFECVTLASNFSSEAAKLNEDEVKLIPSAGTAIYFTRQYAPLAFRHIGIYGFQRQVLQHISAIEPTALAKINDLEQLTWLENGVPISYRLCEHTAKAINTVEDLHGE